MENEDSLNAPDKQINNPLHGVRLADILDYLVKKHGWEYLGDRFSFRCFTHDPSVNSSLKFLRKTDWARKKVEEFYVKSVERERRG
ncbi:VF530 family DNA-binding protein [Cognataquiflexum rubidum]|uniref:VF530 family protein n=1 Tax=Cognataquiflexum rubidum TaxID=2922273 RepID=UPI001F138B88|nr:VF530 family protein [Cognataquiflexum rubidum]MCH6234287.1 VF530 family protein [Cognataquiflexum rubidum]